MLKRVFMVFDWLLSLIIVLIGLYFLFFAALPPQAITSVFNHLGWSCIWAVSTHSVTVKDIVWGSALLLALSLLYIWGYKKKRPASYWVKIAGLTLIIGSQLLSYWTVPLWYVN